MLEFSAKLMVLAGIVILALSLLGVRKITRRLPRGKSCNCWHAMSTLIGGFVLGYASFLAIFWNRDFNWIDLLVPGVFFFGACFVWLSSWLALPTAMDIRRITVLEHETFTDPLTGMYNRRFMQQRLQEEISKARRYGFELALLLLDIDHFKKVNDVYGHPAGDRVLIEVGNLVGGSLRESDILARYGGEELIVIAPNTGPADAALVGERLRKAIESHLFLPEPDSQQDEAIRITVSIGACDYGSDEDDEDSMIKAADANLYLAKERGRNRVVIDDPGTKESPVLLSARTR